MSSSLWVLVTGANRGLGFATAQKLVSDGKSVIVGARSQASADAAVAKLGKATGHPERLAALAVDISDPKSIEAATQTLERDFAGKLGGLINNAAVITGELTEEEYNRLWETNMAGSFGLSKRLATVINEGGHIVHVASVLGQLDGIELPGVKAYISGAKSVQQLVDMPYPAEDLAKVPEPRTDLSVVYLLYNITKAAMLHGAKLEAADPTLVARGITVAAACPGWCRTEMGGDTATRPVEDGAKSLAWAYTSPKARMSHGGFFQDGRQLSIIEVYTDRFGPATWVEE